MTVTETFRFQVEFPGWSETHSTESTWPNIFPGTRAPSQKGRDQRVPGVPSYEHRDSFTARGVRESRQEGGTEDRT